MATYGRSLYALALGVFSGRWALMALGETDFGLFGVVGGLAAFTTFLNGLLSGATARFYAFAIGESRDRPAAAAIDECRRWFNTALLIHLAVPVALVAIGYPLGIFAIERFLTVPPDRTADLVLVWRFTCLDAFIGMCAAPYSAMYTAKEEIAELTVFSFVSVTLRAACLGYMASKPGVWLVPYAAINCAVSAIPSIALVVRARMRYAECRFMPGAWRDRRRLGEVLRFALSRFACAFSVMLGNEGRTILVNRMLGPARNAAMSIGGAVAAQCSTLAMAMNGAFSPVINRAAGEGDREGMRRAMLATCSFAVTSSMLFILPMALEAREVMRIWLGNPPEWCAFVCTGILVEQFFVRASDGLWMGVFADGRIARYQLCEALFAIAALPLAWALVRAGFDMAGVVAASAATAIAVTGVKLRFAKRVCGLESAIWWKRVFAPSFFVSLVSLAAGAVPVALMEPSPARVAATTLAVEAVCVPLAWRFSLGEGAREKAIGKLRELLGKAGR